MVAMEWYIYPAVIAAGFACGFINTLAGSGSLITLPLLIFLGLPATVANGTNRVAILLQNVVAVSSFKQQKVLDFKRGMLLAIPAAIGGIIGAQIAVSLDEETMRRVIGALMAIMLVVLIVRPKRWLEGRPEMLGKNPGWIQYIIFFFIGMYGGFIQAGVGIFLLAGLVLAAGYDLVKANAVKLLIVLFFTIFALIVFILNDQVVWEIGLILAIGNMGGAWIASRMAVKKGATFVRYVLMAVVAISAVLLLGNIR
jgi:uncharacterized membrane protein YfcA